MISLLQTGHYRLIETKRNTKILYLDDRVFAWVEPASMGEILVVSHKMHETDCVLSVGKYRIYGVSDEPYYSDLEHLELEVGDDVWQGYLLPKGLPGELKGRARVIPTPERLTGNAVSHALEQLDGRAGHRK